MEAIENLGWSVSIVQIKLGTTETEHFVSMLGDSATHRKLTLNTMA